MIFVNYFSTFHIILDKVVKKSKNTLISANHDEVKQSFDYNLLHLILHTAADPTLSSHHHWLLI